MMMNMSILEEYFNLLTNKFYIATMIMIIIGIAAVLYFIKKFNECLEPPEDQEEGEGEKNEGEAQSKEINGIEKAKTKTIVEVKKERKPEKWTHEEFQEFLYRDLIDHYAFLFRLKLYAPLGTLRFQDKYKYDARHLHVIDEEKKIYEYEIDRYLKFLPHKQRKCCDGEELLVEQDVKALKQTVRDITKELREYAKSSLNRGMVRYAEFAGVHICKTLELPPLPLQSPSKLPSRIAEISITLLETPYTEPFMLKFKYKGRKSTTILEIQQEGEEEETAAAATSTAAVDADATVR